MSKKPNKKMIGIFTVAGLSLFIGALLLFFGDKLFLKDSDLTVLYFEESIKGLNVGSPVVFRGVEIGKVNKTELVADIENLSFRAVVFISISENSVVKSGKKKDYPDRKEFLEAMIKKGLRARLATQNFLTGQLMIELEILPNTKAVLIEEGRVAEIPTMLSPMGEISKGLQDLPVREVLDNLNKLIAKTSDKLPNILDQAEKFTVSLNEAMATSEGDRLNTLDSLNKTIKDVGEAAQSMRSFTDYLERHPEALLRGKGKY